jgi:hypothetical protein
MHQQWRESKKGEKQSTVRDSNYYLTNLRVFCTNYSLDRLKGSTFRHTVAASLHLRQILYSLERVVITKGSKQSLRLNADLRKLIFQS